MKFGYILHMREFVLTDMHEQLASGARCLNCVMSVHLDPFFMCTSSEDSGQCAHMCTLAWAFFMETAILNNI